MIIGEKPPSKIIKSCDQKGVNLTKKITVYKSLSELEQVCKMPVRKADRPARKIRRKSSPRRTVASPPSTPRRIVKSPSSPRRMVASPPRRTVASPASTPRRMVASPASKPRRLVASPASTPRRMVASPASTPCRMVASPRKRRRSVKKVIAKPPSFFKKVRRSNPVRLSPKRSFKKPIVRREAPRRPPVVRRETPAQNAVPIYSPYPSYSANLKKPYDDFSNMVRGIRSPQEIMVPHEHIAYRREVFLKKIPEHLGENVAALKQRMVDMEHIHRLLEAQLMKCRKSRTPERAVNNNQLVKIEKRIGELRTEENQHNNYVQLMQEFIGKYNQSKQEEHTKIDRLRGEIHGILKKVSSAFELQGQLFDTQEKILTNITNSAQVSKTDLMEWAKGIERVANEKDGLIEALVPATLRLQQVPEETNAQLKDSIRELQKIYEKQSMFGQYGSENRVDRRSYDDRQRSYDPERRFDQARTSYDPRSYPQQSSEIAQVLKNSERESLQKQFERLTDLVLSKQQQQQQAPQSPAVINNAGDTKAGLDELKTMISNLTRMVLEKPAERKSEPTKWDLPETSSANVLKMQEMQRNRDELLPTGRDKGDYDNKRDILASILSDEQKSQQKPQENQKLAMFEKLLGGGKDGGDSSALLDFIIKMKLLKGLGFDVSDIFGGTTAINNNTNTITGAATQTTDDKFMGKLDEIINILKSQHTASPYASTRSVDTASPYASTRSVDTAQSVDAHVKTAEVAKHAHTCDEVYEFLQTFRKGDYEGANGILENLKNSIITQNNSCDEVTRRLSYISDKLGSLMGGVGNITQISQQVSSMNSQTTNLTNEIKNLIIKIQNMASTGQTSSNIERLKDELESKKKELDELRDTSNPLQGQLDEYKKQLEQIKEVLGLIPDCDGLGIIAALKKFKEEMEKRGGKPQNDASVGTEAPSRYDDIKIVVNKMFNLNLDLNNDRDKFIDYLKVIEQLLTENHIGSLETLNEFIAEINKNKKCCVDLEKVKDETKRIEKEKNDALTKITRLEAAAAAASGKPDNSEEVNRLESELNKVNTQAEEATKKIEKLNAEIERLEAAAQAASGKPDNSEEINELNAKIKKLEDGLNKHSGDADNAQKAEKEIQRLMTELAAAEAAREEAEAAREEAEEAAREAAEAARIEATRIENEAREAARKAREEAEKAKKAAAEAEAARIAEEEAARKAEAEKKVDDPKLKKRRDFLTLIENLTLIEKEKRVIYGNRLFEKNRVNEITVSEVTDSATTLYTIPSTIVQRVNGVAKMYAKDVNDLYEIINGIGLVVVRIGGPDVSEGEELASVKNDHITLNTKCDDKEKYGPFLAFGPIDNQKTIYENEQLTDFFKYENDIALFSYGASGSGKTYTLFGNKFIKNGKDEGIIHKIMNDKFKKSKITATAIQWYCGNIYSAYMTDKKLYKYELGRVTDNEEEGVKVFNAVDNKEYLKLDKYTKKNSMILLRTLDTDYFKGNYDQLFTKYIRDRKGIIKIKDFGQNDFVNYFFNPETNDFLDDNKKNLFGKILDNLKTYDISNNIHSFATFDNKKQPKIEGGKLLDGHLIKSEGNPFDDTYAAKIEINGADGLNKYLTQVMKSRPTRATAKNPDSSRSHLFIRFQVTTTDNKTQNIYTCDLGGIEEPLEYFDLAMLEGYWIVLGIKQIGEIIESYNNYKLPVEDVIQNKLKLYLLPTRELSAAGSQNVELLFDFQNIRLDNKTAIAKYFNKLFQIMKYVIGEDKLSDFLAKTKTDALTKIVSFVNVKKQIKKDIDDLARNNACTAAKDSLLFAEKLLKISRDKPIKFGRVARRRSYARKGAARLAPHKQAKRRSFKRSKRPSVGVATSATNKARKRSYRRTSVGRAAQESVLSKLRRRSIRRVRRKRS